MFGKLENFGEFSYDLTRYPMILSKILFISVVLGSHSGPENFGSSNSENGIVLRSLETIALHY